MMITSGVFAAFSIWRRSPSYSAYWPYITDPVLLPMVLALIAGRGFWSGIDFLEAHNPRLRQLRIITVLLFVSLGLAVCALAPDISNDPNRPDWALATKAFLIDLGLFTVRRKWFNQTIPTAVVVLRGAALSAILPAASAPITSIMFWEFADLQSFLGWALTLAIAIAGLSMYLVYGTSHDAT